MTLVREFTGLAPVGDPGKVVVVDRPGWAAANGTSYEIETQRFVDERNIPAGRFGDPVDVGAFCALLCSRYASFLSGQSIPLDGGIINSVF